MCRVLSEFGSEGRNYHCFRVARLQNEIAPIKLQFQNRVSPCRKRSPAKGVWQKGDEKSDRNIRKSDQKVTERVPETKKSDRTPFADLLLRHPEGKKKPININIFGGMVSGQTGTVPGTNATPPRDKMGPVPGTNRPFSV